jgi:membrane associated rhomboid family serine protease
MHIMDGQPGETVPETEHLLRATESPTRVGDWSLVLASAGLGHRVVEGQGRFALLVDARDAAAAGAALDAYDAESAPVVAPPAPDLGPSALGVAAAAGLLAMFAVAGSRDGGTPSRWFDAGSAVAELILRGQWWRTITALCLHGDLLHVVGNVVACLIFVSAVGRWLGPGLGSLLIVGSAALANTFTALVKRHDYVSVGASTATFAALGLLAGMQFVRRWRYDMRRRYVWLPLGAGLGLFAMLGVSQNADVWAHFFGLTVGSAIGAVLAATGVRTPGRIGQGLLSVGVSAVFIGAWLVAFRAIGGGP